MAEWTSGPMNGAEQTLIWRIIRRILPRAFRHRYADTILLTHLQLAEQRGRATGPRFWLAVLFDLLVTGAQVRRDMWFDFMHGAWAGRSEVFDAIRSDSRYALRQLGRSPIFTGVAVLSLSVGTGVVIGGMTLVYSIYFRPLPIPDPQSVYHVYTSSPGSTGHAPRKYERTSYMDYKRYAAAGVFDELAVAQQVGLAISGEGLSPARRSFEAVTGNYYQMLGIAPFRGRWLGDSTALEVVLTHAYWQREFQGDPGAVGRSIRANGHEMRIVGVGPANFDGTRRSDDAISGWILVESLPALTTYGRKLLTDDTNNFRNLDILGRLKDGITSEAASARLAALAERLAVQDPNHHQTVDKHPLAISILDERESRVKPTQSGERIIAFAIGTLLIGIVLLIACVNVAGLMLSRSIARQHEVAVRLVLGASRKRLFSQLFSEAALLAIMGAAAGCLAAYWVLRIVNTYPDAAALHIIPSWHLILFAIFAAMLSVLLFGLAPVLQSLRSDVRDGLSSTHTSNARASRVRGRVLAMQVAFSFVLLVVAMSALNGMRGIMRMDPGFDTRGLAVGELEMYSFPGDSTAALAYIQGIQKLAASTPGVLHVGLVSDPPMNGGGHQGIEPMPNGEIARAVQFTRVDPEYFTTLGLKPIRGRGFNRFDTRDAAPVVIVNEVYARGYQKKVGDYIEEFTDKPAQIVGIVGAIAYETRARRPTPITYYPLAQSKTQNIYSMPRGLLLRTAPGMEEKAAKSLRDRIATRYRDMVPPEIMSMSSYMRRMAAEERIISAGAMTVGGIELALAAVGLYGILLYAVIARRRELGVRLALGAKGAQAMWSVLKTALTSVAWGIGFGALLSVPAVVFLSKMMSTHAVDVTPFLGAVMVACGAVGVACYGPMRRASTVNPATALRHE